MVPGRFGVPASSDGFADVDKLLSSRAGDVEAKSFTNRKAGKDGPISDAMADSMICLLLGMRLRVTG